MHIYFRYWSEFESSINHIPQPKSINNGVIFFVNTYSLTHASLSIGILVEAKKKGIVVLPTGQRDFITSDSSDSELNSIAYLKGYNQLDGAHKHLHEWYYQWRIDWDKRSIEAHGMNIFQHSFFGTKKGFDRWWKKNGCDIESFRVKADNWLNMQRSKNTMDVSNPLKKQVLKRINEYKNRKRPVYVACGKVIYDLAVFYMQSKSHRDISDWITHTVEIVKSKDMLLLIKPHPYEFNKEITMIEEPVQVFFDLIKTEIPENVILLDHSMFQNFELAKVVDLALFWNGTSSIEYGAMGCKTVVCDDWGHNDHPVGHYQPISRDDYEDILSNPNKVSTVHNFHSKCIAFLAYMGSSDVIKLNKYAKASSVNFHQLKRAKINSGALKQLIEGEDQDMTELFKLFEFSISKNWFARLMGRILT